jgi:hypothetical protein
MSALRLTLFNTEQKTFLIEHYFHDLLLQERILII